MDHLFRLKAATKLAQEEEDLPDFLAERILTLVSMLRDRDILQEEINGLCEQVALYDTFAQTGYIGMGVDNLILEESIKRLETLVSGALKE